MTRICFIWLQKNDTKTRAMHPSKSHLIIRPDWKCQSMAHHSIYCVNCNRRVKEPVDISFRILFG